MVQPSQLNEVLPRADWIVIACPLSKETRNLINAASFRFMKKTAHLINIARGEIVDQEALLDALRSHKIAGAHLDAHIDEPLPPDSPFWDLPNVVISPHNASASTGNEGRIAEMFIANFGHWLRGEKMINVQTSL
jgi:phosphoglycerate dehydrogenase-like enzyme